jgi:hypothetical protein
VCGRYQDSLHNEQILIVFPLSVILCIEINN